MALAAELQLQAHIVEKDYALGWFLAGIGAHPEIGPSWVFKGGTCLKKCYFETYRFSEDLDFTLQDGEHLDEAFLAGVFEEIGDWVYNACGLQLPPEARRFEEVFAEKMRALAERQRPRDLYDGVHLYRRQDLQPDRAMVRSTLARKCEFKGIPVSTFDALRDRPERVAIEVEREQMLAHQLPVCPPFNEFWQELPAVRWRESLLGKRDEYGLGQSPDS